MATRSFLFGRLMRLLVLLLAGAALACLSAWVSAFLLIEPTLAYSCTLHEYADLRDDPNRTIWLRVWRAPYGTELQVMRRRRMPQEEQLPLPTRDDLPRWSQVRPALPARPARCDDAIAQRHAWMEAAFGWPWPCFTTAYMMDYGTGEPAAGSIEWGLPMKKYRLPPPPAIFGFTTQAVLPLCPYPPGFALNTVFYAAVLATIGFAWRWLRRRMRGGHGRCPNCGYDLRASPERCPECGRANPNVQTSKRPSAETPT